METLQNRKKYLELIRINNNISINEIMTLTGKKKSLVYDWFDESVNNCEPLGNDLIIILNRFGITLGEYMKCSSLKYGNLEKIKFRKYLDYLVGHPNEMTYIHSSILKDPNCFELLNTYVLDLYCISKYIHRLKKEIPYKKKIDGFKKFDYLCQILKLSFWVDFECEPIKYDLNSDTVNYYIDQLKVGDQEKIDLGEEDNPDYNYTILNFPDADQILINCYYNDDKYCKMFEKYVKACDDNATSGIIKCYNAMIEKGYIEKCEKIEKIIYAKAEENKKRIYHKIDILENNL